MSNKTLTIIACILLGLILLRAEIRMDRMEDKLDDIIQTKYVVKYTPHDVECLTKNIYYEAGVENKTGKYAVAHVTVNRVKSGYWGNNICKVVYAKKQFSWTLKKKLPTPNKDLWEESKTIAIKVLEGARVKGLDNSLYYHADYIKQPRWVDPGSYVLTIGRHIFYNKARDSGVYI
jgi:spore germination cell wall hydrolase CwlJ-like protein